MKNIILVFIALAATAFTGYSQVKVPTIVKTAFSSKFPEAKSVKWEKESKTEFEANFTIMDVKHSANYSDKGEWLETESVIPLNLVPAKVKAAIDAKYKSNEVKSVAKIESSKGKTQYEIDIKKAGKSFEVFYDEDGMEIKS